MVFSRLLKHRQIVRDEYTREVCFINQEHQAKLSKFLFGVIQISLTKQNLHVINSVRAWSLICTRHQKWDKDGGHSRQGKKEMELKNGYIKCNTWWQLVLSLQVQNSDVVCFALSHKTTFQWCCTIIFTRMSGHLLLRFRITFPTSNAAVRMQRPFFAILCKPIVIGLHSYTVDCVVCGNAAKQFLSSTLFKCQDVAHYIQI